MTYTHHQLLGLPEDQQAGLVAQALPPALAEWGISRPTARLIQYGANLTLRVEDAGSGRAYFVRVLLSEWIPREYALSELVYLEYLRENCPVEVITPLRNRDGGLIGYTSSYALEMRYAVEAFEWIDRPFVDEPFTPASIRQAGRTLAALHQAGRQYRPGREFARPRLDWSAFEKGGFLDASAAYAYPDPQLRAALPKAERLIRSTLQRLDGDPEQYGLIHGDFHYHNLFHARKGGYGVVDFDMLGWGYTLFDLVMPWWHPAQEDVEELYPHILAGYGEVQRLPEGFWDCRPAFEVMRRMIVLCYCAARCQYGQYAAYTREYAAQTAAFIHKTVDMSQRVW